jgi:hypothetical protein
MMMCPIVGFDISSDELLGSTTRELVGLYIILVLSSHNFSNISFTQIAPITSSTL